MTTIDYRGRDLIIIPDEELLHLPTPQLLQALLGTHLPADIRGAMGRDKRHAFLRTQPIHFQAVKQALQAQHAPFSVAFEERPALPFATALQVEPRPYQSEELVWKCLHKRLGAKRVGGTLNGLQIGKILLNGTNR